MLVSLKVLHCNLAVLLTESLGKGKSQVFTISMRRSAQWNILPKAQALDKDLRIMVWLGAGGCA